MVPHPRRKFLATATCILSGAIAGCTGSERSQNTTTVHTRDKESPTKRTETSTTEGAKNTLTPVENATASASKSCKGEYRPVDPSWVVAGTGPIGGLELSIHNTSISQGEVFQADVTNVSERTITTGIKGKFDIQFKGTNGWHSVLAAETGWNDLAHRFKPGEGYSWKFPFTKSGIKNSVGHPNYRVCNKIKPGKYRFVYWGVTSEREANGNFKTDYSLGQSFKVS